MPAKVVVSVPASLRTTPRQRAILKSAFKSDVRKTVKSSAGNPVTNVGGGVVTQVIVVNGQASKRGSKRKSAKKAGKKR
jgi:hypothetical protein